MMASNVLVVMSTLLAMWVGRGYVSHSGFIILQ